MANAVYHCTLSALFNLANMENVTKLDPLDYLPSVEIGVGYCLEGAGAIDCKTKDFSFSNFQDLMLVWWPYTVLLGPYWKELDEVGFMLFG